MIFNEFAHVLNVNAEFGTTVRPKAELAANRQVGSMDARLSAIIDPIAGA